jgi:hypothetical protein
VVSVPSVIPDHQQHGIISVLRQSEVALSPGLDSRPHAILLPDFRDQSSQALANKLKNDTSHYSTIIYFFFPGVESREFWVPSRKP